MSPTIRTTSGSDATDDFFVSIIENHLRDWEFYWTFEHGYVWMSPRVEEFTGHAPEKLLGFAFDTIESVIHHDDREMWRSYLADVQEYRAREFELEFRLIRPDGRCIWISHKCVPIYDACGLPVGRRGSHRDITRRKHIEERLAEARKKAEVATTAKNEFLANMSHEIRTPLNGMLGALQVLKSSELNDDQEELCKTALVSGNRLATMLINIVDYTALENNALAFRKRLFSLPEMVDGAVSTGKENSCGSSVDIVTHYDLAFEEVVGDSYRTRQILEIVLNNAIKFTRCGRIMIEALSLLHDHTRKVHVLFVISDTGCGIPEDRIENIFEPFMQVSSGLTRQFQGAGIGMTLAKGLVEKMGGSIHVTSRQGHGTVVSFTLPFNLPGREG